MITGYFQIDRNKISLNKVVLETVFYGWALSLFTLILHLCGFDITVSPFSIVKHLLNPNMSGVWWFVTVYILVLLNSVWLNKYYNNISKRKFLLLLILFWLVGYCFPHFEGSMYFDLYRGVFFYSVGAYIKKMKLTKTKECISLYIITFVIFWLLGTGLCYIFSSSELYANNTVWRLIGMICRTFFWGLSIPFCSISLFLIFEMLDLGSVMVINKVAKTIFATYLISDSELIRSFLWHNLLHVDDFWYGTNIFPLFVIICIVLVIFVCSMIDGARLKLVEPLYLRYVDSIVRKSNTHFQ